LSEETFYSSTLSFNQEWPFDPTSTADGSWLGQSSTGNRH